MSDPPRPWWRPRHDGLVARVLAFLSLALLPRGLIALWQTREFQEETEQRAALTLLARTAEASVGVQRAVDRAVGAAEALRAVSDLLDDPATCGERLLRLVAEGPYAFAGLLPPEGPVVCSSAPAPFELGDRAALAAALAEPRLRVTANPVGEVSGLDVLIVSVPLADAAGFLALSVPRADLVPPPLGDPAVRPLRLVTFNDDGEVLTDRADPLLPEGEGADVLPGGHDLLAEARGPARVWRAPDGAGVERVYTVTPLVPGAAYALGVWSPQQGAVAGALAGAPAVFPLLMWAASLAAAFWALNRFVIRGVTELGRGMSAFGTERRLPDPQPPETPYELREIDAAFRAMADSILHDEARMENAFRERGVLLREVHHRVKNNLQLISSIISMQVRRAPDPAMRAALRRLQARVLMLATIYRSLYTSADVTDVNAADILRAVARQQAAEAEGVELELDLADVALVPDQVVPLAFLASEALSNALANAAPAAPGAAPRVALRLAWTEVGGAEGAVLTVENSVGARAGAAGPPAPGLGLGNQLMRAFAAQIGGAAEVERGEAAYRVAIAFPIQAPAAEP